MIVVVSYILLCQPCYELRATYGYILLCRSYVPIGQCCSQLIRLRASTIIVPGATYGIGPYIWTSGNIDAPLEIGLPKFFPCSLVRRCTPLSISGATPLWRTTRTIFPVVSFLIGKTDRAQRYPTDHQINIHRVFVIHWAPLSQISCLKVEERSLFSGITLEFRSKTAGSRIIRQPKLQRRGGRRGQVLAQTLSLSLCHIARRCSSAHRVFV